MTETHYRRDPISILGLSLTWHFPPWWGKDLHRYHKPWLSYTLYLGLGRLRLVVRVHLPWRKP